MAEDRNYSIALDNKFGYMNLIDVPALVEANTEQWYNQTLTQVDGSVVRLGVVQGEFHWHQHVDEDEFFFVLSGQLLIELEGAETVALGPHQGFNVPKGTMHRTSAPTKTVMLMMSSEGVAPTGV